jgi:lysozyme
MDASVAAVEMIMKFEGQRLTAYLDPSGMPTIGYGTTIYPTGGRVRLGDTISDNEAREFLAFDCARFSQGLSTSLAGITVNQNQFDALLSLTFNIGLGAFQDSTLLQLLQAKDFEGAAKEFPRWNKATINGVKQVLPGLVTRRAAEQALFQTQPVVAAAADLESASTEIGPPPDPDPVTATVFTEAGVTVVVLSDAAGQPTDILTLPNQSPATMAALAKQYPTVTTSTPAPPGATVPPGERQTFLTGPLKVPPVAKRPALNRKILARGSVDSAKHPGRDIHQLQIRLREIGYYTGPITGRFDSATDAAAKAFQADYFSPAEANGKVGVKTWAKLFPIAKVPPVKAAPVKKAAAKTAAAKTVPSFLRLTKTQDQKGGLRLLRLDYVKNGKAVDSIRVYSGSASHQKFRIGSKSRVGSLEPLPEGRWQIGNIQWRDGKNNYNGKVWNQGLGPAKIALAYSAPGTTARSAIMIHIDWNHRVAPGTAGCLGIQTIADYKTLVRWLRDTNPRHLFVDYKLGTCPKP